MFFDRFYAEEEEEGGRLGVYNEVQELSEEYENSKSGFGNES
jgi:hypothetical protein